MTIVQLLPPEKYIDTLREEDIHMFSYHLEHGVSTVSVMMVALVSLQVPHVPAYVSAPVRRECVHPRGSDPRPARQLAALAVQAQAPPGRARPGI